MGSRGSHGSRANFGNLENPQNLENLANPQNPENLANPANPANLNKSDEATPLRSGQEPARRVNQSRAAERRLLHRPPPEAGRDGPEALERHVTAVLVEEIQKALVVGWLHVEEVYQHLVAARRLLQPAPDDDPEIAARQIPRHERRIYSRPERLALLDHAIE